MIQEGGGGGKVASPPPAPAGLSAEQAAANDERIRRLQLQVITQRDNEINSRIAIYGH